MAVLILFVTGWVYFSFLALSLRVDELEAHNLHLEGKIEVMAEAYDRDTALAYHQGHGEGVDRTLNSGRGNIKALEILFSRYPKAAPAHFARWVVEYATKHEVPTLILAGIIAQESSCDPLARSSKNALGLTQVIWRFWATFLQEKGIAQKESDLFNPRISIEAGACILAYLIDLYDGDLDKALKHYSGGAKGYVGKVIRKGSLR